MLQQHNFNTTDVLKTFLPFCSTIVTERRNEVVVEFPEHMKCDAAIGRHHIVISFTKHGLKIRQCDVFVEEFVSESVDLY